MLILAIDSSSDRLKLGIADENRIIAQFDGPDDRSHSERIIPQVDTLLADAGVIPPMFDYLAVAGGPGSFTGLRVGIATLLGLAQTWQKEILIAGNVSLEKAFLQSRGKQQIIVIHCRGDQFYLSGDGEHIDILSVTEIAERYTTSSFAGPGTMRLQAAGASVGHTFSVESPNSYDGGQLAQIFARNHSQFDLLDPVDLDVNYLLKSQPEQRRDESKPDFTISEMSASDLRRRDMPLKWILSPMRGIVRASSRISMPQA